MQQKGFQVARSTDRRYWDYRSEECDTRQLWLFFTQLQGEDAPYSYPPANRIIDPVSVVKLIRVRFFPKSTMAVFQLRLVANDVLRANRTRRFDLAPPGSAFEN